MKNKKTSISNMFLKNMFFISMISVGLCCLIFIFDEYTEFSAESTALRENHIQSRKDLLKTQVGNVVTYIRHMKKQTENRLKDSIKNHVYEAHQIAQHIYDQNHRTRSPDEIRKMIKDALRSIRFNHGRGYIFADSMDGIDQLYPIRPELEGTDLINLQDSHGNFVIRDEINVVRKSKEGFVTGFWPKPGEDPALAYPKISFVKYFKPLDWYFGSGEYLDDVKTEIQDEIIHYIVNIRFDKEGYFFASTFDGDPLFSSGSIIKGTKNISDLTDPDGVKIIREQQKAVKNPDGGFVSYSWPKLNSTTPSPKISFVRGIPDWDWIVGAGTYLDTIETTISQNRRSLAVNLKNNILIGILALLILLILCLFWSRHVFNKIQTGLDSFSSFFQKAATESVTMNPENLIFSEFSEIASSANKMVTDRSQAESALRENEKKYRRIFENIQDVYYETSIDGIILEISPSIEKFSQYKRDELIGKSLYDIYVDPRIRDNLIKKSIDRGKMDDSVIWLKDKDGSEKPCSIDGILVADKQGKPVKLIGSLRDITERMDAEIRVRESEEKYRLLFMNTNDVIYSLDRELRILTVSPSVEKLTGFTSEELIGRQLPDINLLEPAYLEQAFSDVEEVLTGKSIASSIYEIRTKDGTRKFADVSGAPLYQDNEMVGIISVARDITERRRLEKALRENENKFRSLFDFSPQAILLTDVETGKILDVNRQFCELTQYNRSELIGKTTTGLGFYPQTNRDRVIAGLKKHGAVNGVEIDFTVKDGKIISVLMFSKLIALGKQSDILTIFVDISRQKNLEEQLRQAHKMESIGTLSGGIAHDFNNILSIMIGNTELALDDVPEWNSAHACLEEIKTAGLRAKNIVSRLLAFSRKSDQNLKPVAIVPVIKDALHFLRSTIPSNIDIRADIADTGETVLTDPVGLNQIMMNLCINASQAMEQTGGTLVVDLASEHLDNTSNAYPDLRPGDYVKITVSDTGPGIDPEIIDRIFDPYFTTKEVGKGSGMGLAVVHGIIKNHGGFVSADSNPGKGTVFTMLLPKTDEPPESKIKSSEDLPKGTETILFVDDEKSVMKLGQRMLEPLGYQIDATISPAVALTWFRADPDKYDLIITDMTMPEMTGVALAEKAMTVRPDIPIIICTGHSSLIDEEKAKALNIAAFVMKPVTKHKIANVIRQVLGNE